MAKGHTPNARSLESQQHILDPLRSTLHERIAARRYVNEVEFGDLLYAAIMQTDEVREEERDLWG